MEQCKINGISVNDHNDVKEKTIIFIHAFPLTSRMWDLQVHELKNNFRVITYDLRGFGVNQFDGTISMDTHADDLFAIIKELELSKPAVCGLSMGGYILLRALEVNEDFFGKVILSDTKSEMDNNDAKLKRFEQIKNIAKGGKDEFAENFVDAALSETTINNKKEIPTFLKDLIKKQEPGSITNALLTIAARPDTTENLSKLSVETLIMVGDKDTITPSTLSRAMYHRIKNAKLEIIPDSGHFPNLENKAVFNKLLINFINQQNKREEQ